MANMFRCTLASGGRALVLTVTCDSAFAGQTITCTDGTTTLTQICPSTSPYTVEFKIPNSGTWVISSGTDSTSVVITDAIELHNIPNGSTITPTDDIQIWLHCANIWDKSYTTISEVLNDATTVTTLIASNNAVDYMARSTTWASAVCADSSAMTKIGANDYCTDKLLDDSTWLNEICNSTYFESILNVKVPTMTSNTTPSGIASASSESSGYQAYKAFDGTNTNRNDAWSCVQTDTNMWLAYEFTTPINLRKVVGVTRNDTSYPTDPTSIKPPATYIIEGYINNDWTALTPVITNTVTSRINSVFCNQAISSASKATKFRLRTVTKISGAENVMIGQLQFYGRA